MSKRRPGDARAEAARALVVALEQRRGFQDDAFASSGLSDRDQAFARMLTFGVLRWLSALQWLAGQLLERPLKARDRDIEYLVLIGIFQLWKSGTAPHAAVHATAGAARSLNKPWAAGLINAVLRNFQRRRDALLSGLETQEARQAHPAWLLEQLRTDWAEQWPSIVAANNAQPPMWLRVNSQRCTRERYLGLLMEAGLKAVAPELPAEAVLLESPVPVTQLPGFSDGRVSVQDAAAQLAADYVDARPGQRVLDACAAPGGKTGHLLERAVGIELLALDRDAARVRLIEDNLERLGLTAELRTADAADPGSWWDGRPFDRILLDAPCSATGVIRRHPDIKWLRDPDQVESAASQQATLLDALWPLLAPGGMLVYATCSVLRRENSQQIKAFLQRHPDAGADSPATDNDPGRQVLPGEADMDGFFYARLRKPA